MPRLPIDLDLCQGLVLRASDGDADAARRLVEHLWPAWVEMVRANRSMGMLARAEDHVHNVVARLVEKIGRPAGRGLRLYKPWQRRNPDKTFEDWMRIVVTNAIRDYAREQQGRAKVPSGEPSVKHLLNEFASSQGLDDLGARPPITAAQTARELLEFAAARLPADQLHALRLWLEDASFEDMARELSCADADARRLLRAGVATLRRQFGVGSDAEVD